MSQPIADTFDGASAHIPSYNTEKASKLIPVAGQDGSLFALPGYRQFDLDLNEDHEACRRDYQRISLDLGMISILQRQRSSAELPETLLG